jgi:hypothetical protein
MSNEYFDNVHKYVTNGRRLQGVSPERLCEDWVAIFIDVAANPKNLLARDRLHDIESELHLVTRTPPYYYVAQVAHQHVGAVYVALEKLRKEYPEAYAAARSMHEASQKSPRLRISTSFHHPPSFRVMIQITATVLRPRPQMRGGLISTISLRM